MEVIKLWENTPGMCEEIPVLEYYPSSCKKTDATIIICPGGGYFQRSSHEGDGYAKYLNSIGMDAFVCEYRIRPHRFPLPLLDIRRSVRYVRSNAEKYGIDPNKIAVMGSSAGGHLAALVSTYKQPIKPEGNIIFEGIDEVDKYDCRPNATILCYPVIHCPDEMQIAHIGSFVNLLGEGKEDIYHQFSCDELVDADTPTAFIWHTAEDAAVNVINSYLYATALRKYNIPCELHVFPFGRHGMGIFAGAEVPHVGQWTELLRKWLIEIKWMPDVSSTI